MNGAPFNPTDEQQEIIRHDGSAFVTACPGAGKTRVMVERASHVVQTMPPGRGVEFLSFTRSAISELEARLRERAVLPTPAFPNFIGTFDSFVWQFFVAPFGIPTSNDRPRLIPDIEDLKVKPFDGAHALPLSCFDPWSGEIDHVAAKRHGFDTTEKPQSQVGRYSTAAKNLRARFREHGHVGFDEARSVAISRPNEFDFASRLAKALRGRFFEVIIDEAQDCNPDDLKIISLLRSAGIPIKIFCDPHQSIYGFRGGVTDELFAFEKSFDEHQRKVLSGNFRSSRNICNAIAMLRPPSAREHADQPLGDVKDEPCPIFFLSYVGTKVTSAIGVAFGQIVRELGDEIGACPVLAATKDSGNDAVGQPRGRGKGDASFRLAKAVLDFRFASGFQDIKLALNLEDTHRILLQVEGLLEKDSSYHQYIVENEIEPATWRPQVVRILKELQFDPELYADARDWHERAKELVASHLPSEIRSLISRKLKWNAGIQSLLSDVPSENAKARTIHSVKGMQFPAVCVVTTSTKLNGILHYLETESNSDYAEYARKLYVAASRAQKLLAFAVPRSQANRFRNHLQKGGAEVSLSAV